MENPANELWFSPISVWEILLLAEKRRITLGPDTAKAMRGLFQIVPLQEAPLTSKVAMQSRFINLPHQDPADRFLAATAIVYKMTMVTADAGIITSDTVPVLSTL